MFKIIMLLLIAACIRALAARYRKRPVCRMQPQQRPKDERRPAVTKAIKTLEFTAWSWKDRRCNIIRARKENGFYDDYMVVFDAFGKQVTKMIRLKDMEGISLEPIRVELSDEALLAYYETALSEEMPALQVFADSIASDGSKWIEGDKFNNGAAPTKKELRQLAAAFENIGFKIMALNYREGSLKLGLKDSE